MAIYTSWMTATMVRSADALPSLERLLDPTPPTSAAEQAELRADIAALDAEFAAIEAYANGAPAAAPVVPAPLEEEVTDGR